MIPIVFSTDHNYVMPTGVTIHSLLENRGSDEYDIYVLIAQDVNEHDKDLLTTQVKDSSSSSSISFIEMKDQFYQGYEIREISTACYYRLLIPWLIPHIDKIIYCDVDIIFKTNLSKIFEINLKDNYVAGSFPNSENGWISSKKYFNRIGINYKNYINSGVLVINNKLQRAHELDKKYKLLAKKKFLYQDQDIINIVCKNKIAYFDKRYNLMPYYYGITPELENNLIIHYAGDKPWKKFTFAWNEWWQYYKSSIFYDGTFYHNISANILDPKTQFKILIKKSRNKITQLLLNVFDWNH